VVKFSKCFPGQIDPNWNFLVSIASNYSKLNPTVLTLLLQLEHVITQPGTYLLSSLE